MSASGQVTAFEPVACPSGVRATECGFVTVPENRSRPGRTIRLFTAVVRSGALNKAREPLLILSGGPGEKASAYTALAPLFPTRDLVVFDQRGVGLSQPALECPEFGTSDLGNTEADAEAALKALVACGEGFRAQGVDLTAFNASESARDVNDIRIALGYDKINLYGGSYGTRLAQEVMRANPQSLRAVVLDSVIPPQVDRPADTPQSVVESLSRVFTACRADTSCSSTYPNLERTLNEAYANLNSQPVTIKFGGTSSKLNGDGLLGVVFLSLYFAPGIEQLPALIYAARNNELVRLERSFVNQIASALASSISFGLFFATECQGEMAFSSVEALRSAYAQFPQWKSAIGTSPGVASERGFAVCRAWGLTHGSALENTVLRSDVPTLLLAGEFDPVTPPRYLALASANLKNAVTVEVKGQSHGVGLSNPCAFGILSTFLESPSVRPDTGCADRGTVTFKPLPR